MKSWNELSMAEKADVMKLAIEGGVYDLDSIRSGYNEYAKGGKIHIDPSKKGTFTAAASKHGMGVQQFASRVLAHPENYSPAMRKKANFARNASKWKHGDGGNIYGDGGIFGDLVNSLGQKIVSAGKAIGLIGSAPKPKVYVSKPTGIRFKTEEEAKRDAYAYNQAVALARKTNSIPVKHIGSDNKNPSEQRKETWNQFWQQEPVMQHAVDSIASRYGVNPDVLRYRLNTEGFTEGMIHQRNDSVKNNKPVDRGYHLLNQKVGENEYAWYNSEGKKWSTTPGYNAGFMIFGLDDTADYINKGQAFPINERWSDQYNTNEKGRTVHSATGETIAENIGLIGATLKMFTDQAREDFPNASDADIARYGLAYYNRGRSGGKNWVKNGAKGYYYK